MDKLKFAMLVSYVTHISNCSLDDDQLQRLNYMVAESGNKVDPKEVDYMLEAMQAGRKIDVIKGYRSITGMGLKESKDAVEKYWTFPSVDSQPKF